MNKKSQPKVFAAISANENEVRPYVALFFFLMIFLSAFPGRAQVNGDFRSRASGNWSNFTTWDIYNGATWAAATSGQIPASSTASVWIQTGHTVTLTQDATCKDLHLHNAATPRLAMQTYVLNLHGKLRAFSGTINVIPGTNGGPSATPNWITSTAPGKILVLGDTRALTVSGEWSNALAAAVLPNGFDMEINLNTGQIVTCNTDIEVRNMTITSGTLTMAAATNIFIDHNASLNQGTFTIGSGTTLNMGTGAIRRDITTTTANHFASFTLNGSLNFTGVASHIIIAGSVALNGPVSYGALGAETLINRGTNIIVPNSFTYNNDVTISGSGVKTLAASAPTTFNGNLTITGGTLADVATSQLIGPGLASGKTLDMSAAAATAITMLSTAADPFPAFQTYNLHSTLSTVSYNTASVTQNIRGGLSYGNLTIAGASAFKNPDADLTVKNQLTITSGTVGGVNRVITVNGNINHAGVYNGSGTSKIVLSGGSAIHTLTSNGSYTNLELDDPFGAFVNGNNTISGVLSLTNGTFGIAAGRTTTLSGTLNGTGNGLLGGSATSSLIISGSGALGNTLKFDQTGTYPNLAALNITRGSSGVVSLGSNLTLNGTLTVNATGLNVNLGANQVTFNGSGTASVLLGTLNGGSTTDLVFTGTTGISNFPLVTGGVRDLTVNKTTGTLTLAATANLSIARNLTITSGTFSNGTALVTGPGSGSGTFSMNSGLTAAFITTNTSANPFPVFQTYDFHPTLSTVTYGAANTGNTQNISSTPDYGNLVISGGGLAKNATGNTLVRSNLSLATAATIFNDQGFTITVNGNLSTANGASHQSVSTGKILLTGSSLVHSVAGLWGNVELDDANGATLTNTTTLGTSVVPGTLILTAGTFATAGQTFTTWGNVTIPAGTQLTHTSGTKTINGNLTNNGTWSATSAAVTIAGDLTNNNSFTAGSGTYTFTGISKTITGTLTLAALTLGTSATVTNEGDLTITGALNTNTATGVFTNNASVTAQTVSGSGKFTNGTNATLEMGFAGSGAVLSATTLDFFTNTPNTVIYSSTNGTAQNVRNTTYYNLTINKPAGQTANAAGSITINNNFNIQSGIFTDNAAANVITGNSTGTFTIAAGAVYTTVRIASPWLPSLYPAANISISPTATVNFNGGTAHNIEPLINGTATITTYGHVGIASGVPKTVNGTFSINNLTINSSATLADNGNTVTVLGNLSSNGTHTSAGSGKILMAGSAPQLITTTAAGTRQFGNIEIDNATGVTLGGTGPTFIYQVNGTLTLTTGNLNVASATLQFNGAPLAGTPTLLSTASTSVLTYIGTAAGHSIPSSVSDLFSLTLNNINGLSLNSDVTLNSTGTNALVLTSGVLTLGAFDLTILSVNTGAISVSSPGITKMVQVDGAGELRRNVSTGSYLFPVGDNSGGTNVSNNTGADYSPVTLNFTANSATRIIGVRLVDDQHPGDGTTNNYISRYWAFSESLGSGTYTYTGTFTYSTLVTPDLVGTQSLVKLNGWDTNGMFWSQYTTTTGTNQLIMTGYTETSGPLGGSEVTGRINAIMSYTWLPTSGSASWTDPNNWSPLRVSAQPTDSLFFNQGGASIATGVVGQTIAYLMVTNNTDISLTSSTGSQTININNVSGVNTNLNIHSGSTLRLSSTGSVATNIAFLTPSGTNGANIAGTLVLDANTSGNNTYTASTNSVTTVTGTITNNGGAFTGTTATLSFGPGATYNHARNGGAIPDATWNVTSTCNITGVIANAPNPFRAPVATPFGNLIWNCPSQTATGGLSAASFINGNLQVLAGTLYDGGQLLSGPGTGTSKTFTISNGAAFTMTNGTLPSALPSFANYSFGTTSTVNYNANAAQSIVLGLPYGNLGSSSNTKSIAGTLAVANNLTLAGNLNVNGALTVGNNLTLTSGTIADLGNTISVAGALTSNGGVHASTGSGKILMNGSTAQLITSTAAGTRQFGNIEIDNAAGVTLGGATPTFIYQINGTLTLTTGNLNVANATLQFNGNPLAGTPSLLNTTSASNLTYLGAVAGHSIPSSVSNLQSLTLNNANGLSLNGHVTLSSAGVLTLSNGRLTLGAFNLTLLNPVSGAISISSPGIGKMVQADGAGELRRAVNTGSPGAFLFPVGDNSGGTNVTNNMGADYSPVSLNFTANSAVRIIGVRVIDDRHNSDASTVDYLSRQWLLSDALGSGTYTYTPSFTYSSVATSDLVGTAANIKLNRWDATGLYWTQFNTGLSSQTYSTSAAVNEVSAPLADAEFTGRVLSAITYTWLPTTGTQSWLTPANWSPARFAPQNTDILQFTSGGAPVITDVAAQTIARLTVGNNTDVTFTSSTGTVQQIVITPPSGTSFHIQSGSKLRLSSTGASATQIAFTTATHTAIIDGELILDANTAGTNNYIATNSVTTVNGSITNNGSAVTSTAVQLIFANGSFYNHARNGGAVPTSTWSAGSTCNITGITSTTPTAFTGSFQNIIWNCPAQAVVAGLSAASSVNGDLQILAGTFSDRTFLLSGSGSGAGRTFTVEDGATFLMTSTSTAITALQVHSFPLFTTYVFEPNSTIAYSGNASQQVQGGITYGNLTLGANTKTANAALTVAGNLTMAGTSFNNGGFTIDVNGNVTNNATSGHLGAGKIRLTGGSAAHTLSGTSTAYTNLELSDALGATISNSISVSGALTLTSGTLNLGGSTLTSNGTINTVSGLLSGTSSSGLALGGTAGGNMGTLTFAGGGNTLSFLTMNRTGTSPAVTLNTPLSVTTLNLTSGVIDNGTNTITVTGTAPGNITGGGANSYVAGILARNLPALSSAATYAFPVGKSAYNAFALIDPTSAAPSTVRVEVIDAAAPASSLGFPIISLGNEYWQVAVTSGALTTAGTVELTRATPAITTNNVVAYSSTLSGSYNSVEGATTGSTVQSVQSVGTTLGYFAIADKNCTGVLAVTGDLVINQDMIFGGTFNVSGDFTVNNGVTLKVSQGCPLEINAVNITMNGIIDANGSGTAGGTGGARGTSFANCSQEDDQSHSGGRAFGGSASSGAGGGSAGGNGTNGNGKARECGGFACSGNDNGHFGGGGGGGAGSGGSYGGVGGTGAAGAAGFYYNNGNNGSQGTGGAGGAQGSAQGTGTGLDISMGFGGGGAGGGGGCKNNGTAGGAGGNGGGMVSLVASNNLTFTGSIEADGIIGGNGGNGSTASDDQYDCSIGDCGDCDICSDETYAGTGGAGAGGGGGSGGGILLQAFGDMTVTGSLSANGGNGGTAGFPWRTTHGSCGSRGQAIGGAAGGGGRIKLISNPCATNNISPSAFTVLGGTGGNGDVTGGAGGAGSYAPAIVHPAYTPLSVGTLTSTDYTHCINDPITDAIDADVSTGGINSYNYQWYITRTDCNNPATGSAVSPNAGWLGIVGATVQSLPPALIVQGMNDLGGGAGTFCFQRRTQSGTCYGWTGAMEIAVIQFPAAPAVQPATGITQTAFTANWNAVAGATAYELDVATDNAFTTFVSGYNSLDVGNVLTYPVTGLTLGTDYWYRVRTKISSCESANSASEQVTTIGVTTWTANATNITDKTDWFIGANWSGNQVPTGVSDVVIPTTPTGGNYFPVVSGLAVAEVGDLTIQTGASVTFSNAAILEVNGDFNNSGSATLTTGELHMLGSGKTLNGTFNVGILSIQNNTTIHASAQVNVYEVVELESGTLTTNNKLTLKSTATQTGYIDDFDGSGNTIAGTGITGNITIERYIPPTGGANIFHYIGGVTSATAGSKWADDFGMGVIGTTGFITPLSCDPLDPRTAPTSNYGGFFSYHESNVTDCYLTGWKVENSSYPITPGRGIAARIPNGNMIEETGSYQAANTTLSNLTKTTTNTVPFSQGYNLVSNPFYAPIDWSEVATDNLGTWDGAAYVYDPVSGTYSSYNYLTDPLTVSTNQAFFVRTAGATAPSSVLTFTFNADTRTSMSNAVFYRQQQAYTYGLKIEVEANNGKKDATLLAFDALFNDVFDNGYDAMKLYNDAGNPSVYTSSGVDPLSIQALPLIGTATRSVPLNLFNTTTGTHTFMFNGIEDFPQTSIIWLEDLKTGAVQYLRQNNVYTFTATVGDDKERFVLHFSPELLVATAPSNCAGNTGAITLTQSGGIEWTVRMKDELGSVIQSNIFNATQSADRLAAGTYTVELTHPISGYSTTLTVVVDGVELVGAASITTSSTEVLERESFTLQASAPGAATYTWDMGDGNILTQPTVTHAYSAAGTYEVTLLASSDDCNAEAKQFISVLKQDVSTGIVTPADAGVITVYTSGLQLFVVQKLNKADVTASIEVFNNLGQLIYTNRDAVLTYNVAQVATIRVPSGVYFVRVQSAGGETMSKVHLGE